MDQQYRRDDHADEEVGGEIQIQGCQREDRAGEDFGEADAQSAGKNHQKDSHKVHELLTRR
jgi:hypothetical protein